MSRDSDILDNLGLVRVMAAHRHSLLPPSVQLCDLVHDGIIGLIDAVDKFRPAMRVQFEFYAKCRIAGAMLDGLRLVDPLTRTHRDEVNRGLAPPVVTVQWEAQDFRHVPSPDMDPEILASCAEESRLLWAAVAMLPRRWALVLELYFVDDMTLLQISEAMGFNESRACGIKKLAMERVRMILESGGCEPFLRRTPSSNHPASELL